MIDLLHKSNVDSKFVGDKCWPSISTTGHFSTHYSVARAHIARLLELTLSPLYLPYYIESCKKQFYLLNLWMLILLAATISFQKGTIIAWTISSPKMIHYKRQNESKKIMLWFFGRNTFSNNLYCTDWIRVCSVQCTLVRLNTTPIGSDIVIMVMQIISSVLSPMN